MTDSTNENGGSPAWREEMEGLIRKATEELERQGYNEDLDLARQREVAVQLLGMAAQQPGPAGEFWRAVMQLLVIKAEEVLRRGTTGKPDAP